MADLSQALSLSSSGLRLQSARLVHVSENIAHADTPGYQRKLLTVADSVEKHPFAGAEYRRLRGARSPFLSGVSRLLRCGKDLR